MNAKLSAIRNSLNKHLKESMKTLLTSLFTDYIVGISMVSSRLDENPDGSADFSMTITGNLTRRSSPNQES